MDTASPLPLAASSTHTTRIYHTLLCFTRIVDRNPLKGLGLNFAESVFTALLTSSCFFKKIPV